MSVYAVLQHWTDQWRRLDDWGRPLWLASAFQSQVDSVAAQRKMSLKDAYRYEGAFQLLLNQREGHTVGKMETLVRKKRPLCQVPTEADGLPSGAGRG